MRSDFERNGPVGYRKPRDGNLGRVFTAPVVYGLIGVAIGLGCGLWLASWLESTIVIVGAGGVGIAEGAQAIADVSIGIVFGIIVAVVLGILLSRLSRKSRRLGASVLGIILLVLFSLYLVVGFRQNALVTAINGLEAEHAYNRDSYLNQLVAAGGEAVPLLIKVARSDPRPVVRRRAVEVLARMAGPSGATIPVLQDLAHTSDTVVRDAAKSALKELGHGKP